VWRACSSSSGARSRGLTLIELLVTLVILSILASAAIPFAELTVRREKEQDLRRALREVRTAIDSFHDDWTAGRISKLTDAASDDGYPKTLQALVDGVDTGTAKGGKRRYLRRVPPDPMGETEKKPEEQWVLRGYQDDPGSTWGGRDVYDIHSASDRIAIDGTRYRDW
jgi:general secretion pathway protein G